MESKPRRIFKAYLEDWEAEAITKRDDINKAKLLKKYGGLNWFDPDHNNMLLYSDSKNLHWTRVSKKSGGGYCVNARNPNYDEKDPDNSNNVEPWLISETLIGEIAHYYKSHPKEGVIVEEKLEDDDDNVITTNAENNIDNDDDVSTSSTDSN